MLLVGVAVASRKTRAWVRPAVGPVGLVGLVGGKPGFNGTDLENEKLNQHSDSANIFPSHCSTLCLASFTGRRAGVD